MSKYSSKSTTISSNLNFHKAMKNDFNPQLKCNQNDYKPEELADAVIYYQTQNKYKTEIKEYSSDGFSNTSHSDKDNIYINKISFLTEDLKHCLTKEEYERFLKIVSNHQLEDLLSKSSLLDILNKEVGISSQTQNKISTTDILPNVDELSEFVNYNIEEVVSTESGYSAVVLQNPNTGNYMIINSCTDSQDIKDLGFIAYMMADDMFNDKSLITTIGQFINLFPENMTEDVYSLTEEDCKRWHDGQINDSYELIKKYSDKLDKENSSSKLELYGYSLGGGNMVESLSKILRDPDNSKVYDNIESVSVYNPYLMVAQGESAKAADYLKNCDKLLIYSAQEDYVTEFNDIVQDLEKNNKIVYLNSEELKIENVMDLFGAITGSGGNHGFYKLAKDYYYNFDEDGNLNYSTNRVSMIDTAKKISPDSHPSNRREATATILETLILKELNKMDSIEIMGTDYKSDIEDAIGEFFYKYCSYKEVDVSFDFKKSLVDSFFPILWDVVKTQALEVTDDTLKGNKYNLFERTVIVLNARHRSDDFYGKDNLRRTLNRFLDDDQMFAYLADAISYYKKEDILSYKFTTQELINGFMDIYNDYLEDEGIIDKKAQKEVKNGLKDSLEDATKSIYLSKYQDHIIEQLDAQLKGCSKEKNLDLLDPGIVRETIEEMRKDELEKERDKDYFIFDYKSDEKPYINSCFNLFLKELDGVSMDYETLSKESDLTQEDLECFFDGNYDGFMGIREKIINRFPEYYYEQINKQPESGGGGSHGGGAQHR